ncbi:MAG: tripartite tricarboxylate transporter TctB family protein [Candidatus Puniceispirillum sp.]|jgi:hypothetical protein
MNRNFVSGLIMLAIGVSLVFILIPMGIDTPKKVRYAALSPNYYPYIVAIVLSAIGGAIIVRSRHFQPDDDSPQAHPNAARRICLFLLLLGLYAGALNLLGFVVASMLALVGSLLLAGERRATIIIPVAALLPVVLYLFFYKIANIPIPLGIAAPLLEGL